VFAGHLAACGDMTEPGFALGLEAEAGLVLPDCADPEVVEKREGPAMIFGACESAAGEL
jgi:hypothetical protein